MEALSRQEVKHVIEGRGCAWRIPLLYDIWIYENVFDGDLEQMEAWKSRYPRDVDTVEMIMPGMKQGLPEAPDYCFAIPGMKSEEGHGLDEQGIIKDWENKEEIEVFYATFPNADAIPRITQEKKTDGRYLLCRWWFCYFERLWMLRGMENALTDFYLYPEEIHRLFGKLTEFYMRAMERAKEELDVDGFFVSDDIGTQTGPFFSVEIFREFFKPYYKKLFDKAHELGTHFWLHSCGNIKAFLPDLIEIGLDVIHPIQKNTMDEREIAEEFGDRICIWAGIDVQYLMAFGTPDEVRSEVDYLIKTYRRKDGRFMLTMGNGSTPDWKIENLEAMYEESLKFLLGRRGVWKEEEQYGLQDGGKKDDQGGEVSVPDRRGDE